MMYRASGDPTTALLGYRTGERWAYGVADAPCGACVAARFAAQGHRPERHRLHPAAPIFARTATHLSRHPAGTLIEFVGEAVRTHLVLPLPGCGCVGMGQHPMGKAVSDLVGLVRDVDRMPVDPEPMIFASATGCDAGAFGRPGGIGAGTGCGAPAQAERAAIGETLERYAAGVIPDELPIATVAELDAPCILPEPHAFAYQPVGVNDPIRWVKGRRIVDDSACWVPAAMVYFPYVCADGEPRRSMGSSQGLAAGPDPERATIHAACEVIERDAFMRAWRFDGPRFRLPNPYAARADLHFALVPNRFGLQVVTAFSESDAPPYCVAGIAARGSVAEAIDAAAREAIGGRAFFHRRQEQRDRSIEARHRHAIDPAMRAARADWLARPLADPDTPALSWREFRTRIPDAVVVDITPSDIAALGLVVVRVCIPGCHMFEPCADSPFLGGDRTPIPY